jgi:hypothetical protein
MQATGQCHPKQERASTRSGWIFRAGQHRLLGLQFATIIAPGNLRPCRGQSHVPVFELLLPKANGSYLAQDLTS